MVMSCPGGGELVKYGMEVDEPPASITSERPAVPSGRNMEGNKAGDHSAGVGRESERVDGVGSTGSGQRDERYECRFPISSLRRKPARVQPL